MEIHKIKLMMLMSIDLFGFLNDIRLELKLSIFNILKLSIFRFSKNSRHIL